MFVWTALRLATVVLGHTRHKKCRGGHMPKFDHHFDSVKIGLASLGKFVQGEKELCLPDKSQLKTVTQKLLIIH